MLKAVDESIITWLKYHLRSKQRKFKFFINCFDLSCLMCFSASYQTGQWMAIVRTNQRACFRETMAFFLNRAELSLNSLISANSWNPVNH